MNDPYQRDGHPSTMLPVPEKATLITVDPETYTASILTDTGRHFEGVQWSDPVVHPDGDGEHRMPRRGAQCLVTYTATEDLPIITHFIYPRGGRGSRPQMSQGDWTVQTESGSKVYVHNDGLIEVMSTDLCLWQLIPATNIMRGVAENYEMITLGSVVRFVHDREARTTLSSWHFKDQSQAENFKLMIEAGYINDGSLYRILFDDPESERIAQVRIGNLPSGHVMDFGVDNELSFSFGEDEDDGTMWRLSLMRENKDTLVLAGGRNDDTGAVFHLGLDDRGNEVDLSIGDLSEDRVLGLGINDVWELGIKSDGTTNLNINDNMTVEIEETGTTTVEVGDNITLTMDEGGDVRCEVSNFRVDADKVSVVSSDINLGDETNQDRVVTERRMAQKFNALIVPTPMGPSGPPTSPITPGQVGSNKAKAS